MIDSISPVSGSLAVGGAERGAGAAGAVGGDGANFGAMLSQLAGNAAHVVRNAEATAVAGIQGTTTVQQVVEAVMSAEQTLQGAVAIRDKVVAAYLELSRMQI